MRRLTKSLIAVLFALSVFAGVGVPVAHATLSQVLPLAQTTLFTDPNLVSSWPLNGNSNDAKGSNNMTDTNITYSASSPPNANFGQHAVLGGSSKISKAVASGLSSGAGKFTIMGWMQTSGTGSQTLFSYGNWSTCNSTTIYSISGATGHIYFAGQSCDVAGSIVQTNDNVWHKYYVTYDGTNLKNYVDGTADGTGTPVLNVTGTLLTFGTDNNGTGPLTGNLIDIAYFTRDLSAAEITADWAGTNKATCGTSKVIICNAAVIIKNNAVIIKGN